MVAAMQQQVFPAKTNNNLVIKNPDKEIRKSQQRSVRL